MIDIEPNIHDIDEVPCDYCKYGIYKFLWYDNYRGITVAECIECGMRREFETGSSK